MTELSREELRRWALNFMGWEFQQETPPKYCPSGENLGRWRHPTEYPEWLCAHCQEDDLPQFLTDMNAVMGLVEKMREMGMELSVHSGNYEYGKGFGVVFYPTVPDGKTREVLNDKDFCTAILNAAHAAHQERSRYEPTDEGEVD